MPARFPVHAQTGVRVNAAHKEQAMKRKAWATVVGAAAMLAANAAMAQELDWTPAERAAQIELARKRYRYL